MSILNRPSATGSIFSLLFVLSAVPCVKAIIVDRVAVAVGAKVITASDIDRRIRLTAFQNGETPDFSLASRKQAAERLIDQRLVEREMDVGHYPRLPAERGKELLADYEKANYRGDHAAMLRALTDYRLTEADVEEDLLRQSDLLTFLDLRFRPGVQVTEQDVLNYFNTEIAPRAAAQRQQTLDEMRDRIERQLTDARADKELEAWLRDQRKRTKIDYVEQDLK